jgi:hypothetical protein
MYTLRELRYIQTMRKPILVGTDNPHPGEPLAPRPVGCTGWRIWQLLRSVRPEVTEEMYEAAFARTNMEDRPQFRRGDTVVLLGEEVRRYVNLPKIMMRPVFTGGVTYYMVPHPSGLCRFYNKIENRVAVATILEQLYSDR